jgi:fatty-acid peroxygenase
MTDEADGRPATQTDVHGSLGMQAGPVVYGMSFRGLLHRPWKAPVAGTRGPPGSTTPTWGSRSGTNFATDKRWHISAKRKGKGMAALPSNGRWDSTFALLRDPYRFISRTCGELQTDVFRTRLLGHKTICMTGADAAAMFYSSAHLTRKGAAPKRVKWTLFGSGGVQGMDGVAHRHRKAMFLSLMTPQAIDRLTQRVEDLWREDFQKRPTGQPVVLYDQLQEVLAQAVCQWAGVRLPDDEFPAFRRELTALFDSAGKLGPKHWWSRWSRATANSRMKRYIEQIRDGKGPTRPESPAHVIAVHRDDESKLLDADVAAVELLNVLRPTVAVSVYMVQAALALHQYPQWVEKIRASEQDDLTHHFAQEVRRYYPFFPAVPAIVKADFTWNDYRMEEGARVLLDLYGTNHDQRVWTEPDHFHPERIIGQQVSPFALIPQGGGDHAENHRCPGEWISIELIKMTARFLTQEVQYDVPAQDLEIDFTRLPALPKSKFRVENVHVMQNAVAS